MRNLQSLVAGSWQVGTGEPQTLVNPTTEEVVAYTSAEGLDLEATVSFARNEGGPALRALTLAERGAILEQMAKRIHEHRNELLELAMINGGNTRSDAKFDVDGAAGALAHYATIGKELGDTRVIVDGDGEQVGQSPRLSGRHVYLPRKGVALLINAFNFPAWGFGEKAACALLAGMPVICKPATSTAVVAARMLELIADAAPPGVVSLVSGSAHDLPKLLGYGDAIAFTGSSGTAQRLRALPNVMSAAVRLNIEADSLNAAVLGPDLEPGSDTWELFLRDLRREMTQKTGQKCTATRRIFVPEDRAEVLIEALVDRLGTVIVGDPFTEGVRMGPVASAQQHRDVLDGIGQLAENCDVVLDGRPAGGKLELKGAEVGKGYFVGPTLLQVAHDAPSKVHDLEVFGPVATIVTTPGTPEVYGQLLARGGGGLVGSVYSDDRKFAAAMLMEAAPHHGRLVFGSKKVAEKAFSPGMVLPQLLHGGPGRAGGGEELGGMRGLAIYAQRTAIQADRALIDAMLKA